VLRAHRLRARIHVDAIYRILIQDLPHVRQPVWRASGHAHSRTPK
jgi:hypothetical protein